MQWPPSAHSTMAELDEREYLTTVSRRLFMLMGMLNSEKPPLPEEIAEQRGKLEVAMGRWIMVASQRREE